MTGALHKTRILMTEQRPKWRYRPYRLKLRKNQDRKSGGTKTHSAHIDGFVAKLEPTNRRIGLSFRQKELLGADQGLVSPARFSAAVLASSSLPRKFAAQASRALFIDL